VRRLFAIFALLCLLLASAAGAEKRIKLASFVPEGSVWDKNLRQMGEEWKRGTGGRVSLKVFAGGQQGEEPTVVSKMRLDVLQAAALTILGLAHLDGGFNVFAIPFFYESYEELHHVMGALTPELESRLEAKGFVMLNWGDAGWLQVFSKQPVASLDALREIPIYTSAGFDEMVQWYRANGFEPRPLAFSDVPTALSTGLIEAVPITPVAALFLQWYRTAPHMIEIGLSPLVGATVLTKKTWKALSEEDRATLRAAAGRTQERLREAVPRQDREAIAEMERRGLTVAKPSDADAWRELGNRFATLMRGSYVPEALFDRAVAERDAFRSRQGEGP
jgi:TRAP-type C4-dicarboxylate transport system substrate-binding protein